MEIAMQTFGGIIGVLFGLITWGIVLVLSHGNPLGKAGASDALLFFAPLLALTFPAAARAADKGNTALAVWLVAFAPIFGGLNMAACVVIAGITQMSVDGLSITVVGMIAIWFVPAVYSFFKKTKES